MRLKIIQMEVALALEFVLGMVTNLFGVPPDEVAEHPEPLFAKIAFGMHGLLGLIILIGALFTFYMTLKQDQGKWKIYGLAGLCSVLIAFGGGIGAVALKENAGEIASLVMSLGFLMSFVSYGWLLLKLHQE